MALASQWTASQTGQQATQPGAAGNWWQQFNDPLLTELLARSRAGSQNLHSAALRITQAQAQLAITDSGMLPGVQLSSGANFTKPDFKSQLSGKNDGSTTLQLAAQASWEPDFWGKVRRAVESDGASWFSSMAAYEAAQVALEASVAATYFSLCTLEQRMAVAQANLTQQAESLRIAEARYQAGATSELDQRQAQVQYEQIQGQIPALRAAMQQSMHGLSVLLGEAPDFFERTYSARAHAPALPVALPLGVPRDLLQRRPDVVQAELAAVAQSARIGQAQAALYPSFTLSGSFGFQSSDAGNSHIGDIFSWGSQIRAVGAGLVLPIFDRGRLISQVRVQDALFEQALLAYQTQVLKAQQEVEDAVSLIGSGAGTLSSQLRARDAARRSAALAMQRYKTGVADYTTVTTADQARLQVEDALEQTNGNLLQAWVSAFRALGGGWDGEFHPLPSRRP